jgi:Ser/Thr protein kinase RdoA (MazF antagonist)
LFRVIAPDGRRFVLRMAVPTWRTRENLVSEALWLEALARDTDLGAPRVFRSIDTGERVLELEAEGVPGVWRSTLMTWVPGPLLGTRLDRSNLAAMGRLFARLHEHGAAWKRPEGFSDCRFDRWLSRGEPCPLLEDAPDRVRRADESVRAAYAALDPNDLRVIHCDLWHDNIKVHRGRLLPFDFEDTILGYRAHDIAMAMLDLLETVGESEYPALLGAFREGYGSVLPLPKEAIEPFQLGRILWKLNWIARFNPEALPGAISRHRKVFSKFEETGAIVLPDPYPDGEA